MWFLCINNISNDKVNQLEAPNFPKKQEQKSYQHIFYQNIQKPL